MTSHQGGPFHTGCAPPQQPFQQLLKQLSSNLSCLHRQPKQSPVRGDRPPVVPLQPWESLLLGDPPPLSAPMRRTIDLPLLPPLDAAVPPRRRACLPNQERRHQGRPTAHHARSELPIHKEYPDRRTACSCSSRSVGLTPSLAASNTFSALRHQPILPASSANPTRKSPESRRPRSSVAAGPPTPARHVASAAIKEALGEVAPKWPY
eukprot:6192436-Pleurochrysis_carterae.AAC.1